MRFAPGNPGGPGRPKGTKILSTQAKIREIIEKYGDPLEGLATIAADKKNDMNIRVHAYKEVAKYAYAPRKAEDESGETAERLIIELDMPRRER